jgi:hypothetical protein
MRAKEKEAILARLPEWIRILRDAYLEYCEEEAKEKSKS